MTTNDAHQPVALITGASRGLGLALARALAADGWALVIDARGGAALRAAAHELGRVTSVRAISGDIADDAHRRDLVAAAHELGGIDALVHNASVLGPSPQPALADYPLTVLEYVYAANVFGPLRLTQLALPELRPGAAVVAITSDAAVEAYEGWGGYGSSKAALEQVSAILAAEHPDLRVYRVDPGDMNTQMHAEAFPGEDISDRPPPEDSVPGLVRLITGRLPSGRYQARAVAPSEVVAPPEVVGPPEAVAPTVVAAPVVAPPVVAPPVVAPPVVGPPEAVAPPEATGAANAPSEPGPPGSASGPTPVGAGAAAGTR